MLGRIKNVTLRRVAIVVTFPLVLVFAAAEGIYENFCEALREAIICWNRKG